MKAAKNKISLNGLTPLRKRLGVTQAVMAMYLNVNLSTLKMAESGMRSLPTRALIKAGNIEIKLLSVSEVTEFDNAHPAEKIPFASFEYEFDQLFKESYKSEYNCFLAERKLETMMTNYQKAREKIYILETVLKEFKLDDEKTDNMHTQMYMAKILLLHCGLHNQALLKAKITMLKAQCTLQDNLKKQLKEELPAMLFEDDHIKK